MTTMANERSGGDAGMSGKRGNRVYLLLPVHNRRATTQAFVESLRRQTHSDYHLLLIDDGSTDGTAAAVEAAIANASVLRGQGSWWWAGCLQQGFEWLQRQAISDEDIVLIINDDTTFAEDFLANAVRYLRTNPDCLLLSRSLDSRGGIARETGIEADFMRFRFRVASAAHRINCLSTRGLFLRWGAMRRLGGFRPRLLPHYWSDYEYTLRAARHGMRCVTDATVALHSRPELTGNRWLDDLTGGALVRQLFSIKCPANPVYSTMFVMLASPLRWMPTALLLVWGRSAARLLWQGLLRRPMPGGST